MVLHNLPGTPCDEDVPPLQAHAAAIMTGAAVRLDSAQAQAVAEQLRETGTHRGWQLLALAVMANHVHVVVGVAGDPDPEKLLGDFKAWATRRLNAGRGAPRSLVDAIRLAPQEAIAASDSRRRPVRARSAARARRLAPPCPRQGAGERRAVRPPVDASHRRADAAPVAAPLVALVAGSFLPMILDNLRKAGVKGTDKRQRIAFARLDPFPGEYIQAEGETDTGAAVRVCVGPEFGTLGDADIKKPRWRPSRGAAATCCWSAPSRSRRASTNRRRS